MIDCIDTPAGPLKDVTPPDKKIDRMSDEERTRVKEQFAQRPGPLSQSQLRQEYAALKARNAA